MEGGRLWLLKSDKNIEPYKGLFSFKRMESTIPRVPLKWLGMGHIIPSLNCIAIVWSIGPGRGSHPCPWEQGWRSVRTLTSHQCGPGSNPGINAICGLSLLLVLSLAPRCFSQGTPVFPSPQKTKHFQIPLRPVIR